MNEEKIKKILDWFMGSAGDHIQDDSYKKLLIDLANELMKIFDLYRRFHSVDEVIEFVYGCR